MRAGEKKGEGELKKRKGRGSENPNTVLLRAGRGELFHTACMQLTPELTVEGEAALAVAASSVAFFGFCVP